MEEKILDHEATLAARRIFRESIAGTPRQTQETKEYVGMKPGELKKLAFAENRAAQFVLGKKMMQGTGGVRHEEEKGLNLLFQSATAGLAEAQIYLALYLLTEASVQKHLMSTALMKTAAAWVQEHGLDEALRLHKAPRVERNEGPRRHLSTHGPK